MRLIRTEEGLFTPDGEYQLRTHAENAECAEFGCVVHNPTPTSPANAGDWELNWRTDRGIMERICPCGVGHPDADAVNFWLRTLPRDRALAEAVHGCCGCCQKNAASEAEEAA